MVVPLRGGGGGKGCAINEKKTLFVMIFFICSLWKIEYILFKTKYPNTNIIDGTWDRATKRLITTVSLNNRWFKINLKLNLCKIIIQRRVSARERVAERLPDQTHVCLLQCIQRQRLWQAIITFRARCARSPD